MTRRGSVPVRMRRQVALLAAHACEYCQTLQQLSPIEFEVDHIVPHSLDGETVVENLCFACRTCNGFKQARTEASDPQTDKVVPLFHPRLHVWTQHFQWGDGFTRIEGITPTGRATVNALNMNSERMVSLRKLWVAMEVFPVGHDD